MENKKLQLKMFIIEMMIIIVISFLFNFFSKGDFFISYLFLMPLCSIISLIFSIIGSFIFKYKIENIKLFLILNGGIFTAAIIAALMLIILPIINNPI